MTVCRLRGGCGGARASHAVRDACAYAKKSGRCARYAGARAYARVEVLLHGRRRSVRPRFSASRVHGIFRTSGEIVPDRIPIQKLRKKLREMGGTAPVFAAFKRFSTLDERLGVSVASRNSGNETRSVDDDATRVVNAIAVVPRAHRTARARARGVTNGSRWTTRRAC